MILRCDGHVVASKNVVFDGLKYVSLHQRNVLVSRGMVNHRRFVVLKDFVQAIAILNASDLRIEGNKRKGLTHFAFNFKQRGLCDFKSNDSSRLKTGDLPAKFEPYRSGRAGHENNFALQRAPYRILFEVYGRAAKKILK